MTAERGGAPYLKRMKITSFGAFANKVAGPFTPHLNVVFGENEAGKSTLASFAGGVLFGWEEARGVRNTYKPRNAERAGSLFFAPRPEEGDALPDEGAPVPAPASGAESGAPASEPASDPDNELVLSRVRNADGLQGPAELVDDIDRETFQTMFSLTADELRSLRNTTDMTAKLLTAGSGTGASPAHALVEVQARLAEYTSKAAGIEHSITRLTAEQDDLRAQMAQAADETERYKAQDKEFHELAPQRAQLLARLDALNASIEELAAQRASLEKLDAQRDQLRRQRDSLREDEAALAAEHRVREQALDPALVALGAADERALRDRIDALAEEQAKCAHSVDLAKENCATSTAAYEALLETEDVHQVHERRRRQRSVQVGLSIALPLVFVAAGVPLFMHGREITSLSFTALGIGLVVFALMLAAAALVMLFRPDKAAEAQEARKQDAQWVMLQDKKKLEACLSAQEQLAARIRAQFDAAGLSAAQGSLRSARSLLSEAKDARAEAGLFQQRQQALVSRLSAVEDNLADIERQRARRRHRGGRGRRHRPAHQAARRPVGDQREPEPPLRRAEARALPSQARAPIRRAEAALPTGAHAPRRERPGLRPPAPGEAHAGGRHRRMGIEEPARGVPPGQPPALAHDRRALGQGGHDARGPAAGDGCGEDGTRARAPVAGNVPAALPGAAHRPAHNGRQRGPLHPHSGRRYPGELRCPAPRRRRPRARRAGPHAPGDPVHLP